jgi:1-aminocyclopropane-1-carboxylate deaminase
MPEVSKEIDLELLAGLLPVSTLSNLQRFRQSYQLDGEIFECLRLDQLHPTLSGNKFFKLLGHLEAFRSSGRSRLLSFGGRWSNHLHALAHAAVHLDVPSMAMVLGYPEQPLTDTLRDCQRQGMALHFCNRKQYQQRYDETWRQTLSDQYDAWVIPEGGDGEAGLRGFELLQPSVIGYDEIWVAAGTGTSAIGLAENMLPSQTLVIVNAVQDQGALAERLASLSLKPRWRFADCPYSLRFGKLLPEHRQLMERADAVDLPLDPVYTVRLLSAFLHARQHGRASDNSLLIHSGGLQGRRGMSF